MSQGHLTQSCRKESLGFLLSYVAFFLIFLNLSNFSLENFNFTTNSDVYTFDEAPQAATVFSFDKTVDDNVLDTISSFTSFDNLKISNILRGCSFFQSRIAQRISVLFTNIPPPAF